MHLPSRVILLHSNRNHPPYNKTLLENIATNLARVRTYLTSPSLAVSVFIYKMHFKNHTEPFTLSVAAYDEQQLLCSK